MRTATTEQPGRREPMARGVASAPAEVTMDDVLDVSAIFDSGQHDEELAELRLQHPLYVISHHRREGWYAHPSWRDDTDGDLHTVTAAELSKQMTEQAKAYRAGLLTLGPYGWPQ